MTDRIDPTRHALDDAELEVLLTGKIDDSPELRHNPVAAFLLDARQTRFAPSPSPDGSLNELFQLTDSITAPIAVIEGPITDDEPPATELVISKVAPLPDEPVVAAPVAVYKASTLRVLVEALSPSPSKILMALSAVLLVVIGAQALGAIQLLGGDGDGNDVVAGVDPANTITSTTVATVAPTGSTAGTSPIARPVDETPTSATTARTAQTEAPTTVVTEVTETSDPTVETTTETTEAPETTESVTTEIETSTTLDPSTSLDTSIPSTTVPTTGTISPTPSTTNVPGVVIILPGRRYQAPGDLPTGFYSARVAQESTCSVDITYAEGNSETFQAPAGGTIVFQLFVGSEVVTGAGCPQIYRPSPG